MTAADFAAILLPGSLSEPAAFFTVALGLSLLLAVAEVAGAYRDKPKPWRAVINPWALPFYLLYLLLTFLMGMVLLEHELIEPSWTSAAVLGLLGPALFKTQTKLFRPLSGGGDINANIERIVQSVQGFCFAQINASLSYRRIAHKERLAAGDSAALEQRVQTLYGDSEYQTRVKPLIDERRSVAPGTVNAFLVDLIERKDPNFLEHPLNSSPQDPQ